MGRWMSPDSNPTGSVMHLPPSLKYSKQPLCNTARFSSVWFNHESLYVCWPDNTIDLPFSAANKRYKAIARTLIAVQYRLRPQWKASSCCNTRSNSVKEGIFSGDSRSRKSTTSFKATVMPPLQIKERVSNSSPILIANMKYYLQ